MAPHGIRAQLLGSELAPDRLELEITEQVLLEDATEIQGYLFSPPKSIGEMLKLFQPAAQNAADAA